MALSGVFSVTFPSNSTATIFSARDSASNYFFCKKFPQQLFFPQELTQIFPATVSNYSATIFLARKPPSNSFFSARASQDSCGKFPESLRDVPQILVGNSLDPCGFAMAEICSHRDPPGNTPKRPSNV